MCDGFCLTCYALGLMYHELGCRFMLVWLDCLVIDIVCMCMLRIDVDVWCARISCLMSGLLARVNVDHRYAGFTLDVAAPNESTEAPFHVPDHLLEVNSFKLCFPC